MQKAAFELYQSKPFVGSSHSWAFQKLAALSSSARVLDIGSGSGVMGQFLGARGIQQVCAVEVDPATIQHTSSLYRRIAPDLAAYAGEKFEMILLLDILEHLADPLAYLKQTASLLAPGGQILISVPNVAHWSVRIPLLFGVFKYYNRGILDRTHLHFFTRKHLLETILAAGDFEVVAQSASIEPVEFVLPPIIWDNALFRFISRIRLSIAGILPGFFAYQHLAVVRLKAQ